MNRLCLGFILLTMTVASHGQSNETPPVPPEGITAIRDLNYAGTENWRQTLDVFVPKTTPAAPLPLVVFIHGGGWTGGSKNTGGILFTLIHDGAFIGASVNYRLSQEAKYPAQIHDCKAAIRWLRAHAKEYHINPEKIAVFGISAGGHLVSLLGTGGDVKDMEGSVGGNLEQSSRVKCVVNFCGPADFLTFGRHGNIDPETASSAIGQLLGGTVSTHQDIAKAASPVTYITKDDPPFLHIHGTADELVPYTQAQEFDEKLKAAGVSSILLTGEKGAHVFFSRELVNNIRTFLDLHLLGKPGEVKAGPVAIK